MTEEDLSREIFSLLDSLGRRNRVLVVPPDITRFHSMAGTITEYIWQYYGEHLTDILPALGTHAPMSEAERSLMYGTVPEHLFRIHRWKSDTREIGIVPASFVREVSEGLTDFPIHMSVNNLLIEGGHDLILSVGQVVPHEILGIANYNKNILVGTGGVDCIDKTHFLGAAYGMERIMGRADTPVRRVFNYASSHFLQNRPLVYILTVIAPDASGEQRLYGLFSGDDEECFIKAADLARQLNVTLLEKAPEKIIVYLNPGEFRNTWHANKSIYRTRMAIADGGELIILAPGLRGFHDDPEIDRQIRRFGYRGSKEILSLVKRESELAGNMSVAAHLIHGSSDGRFNITYCPGSLSRSDIEGVHYSFGDLDAMMKKYDPNRLKHGWNTLSGSRQIFFISNPALGLWAEKARFIQSTV